MEKTFTLKDLQFYLQEIKQIENRTDQIRPRKSVPGSLTLLNLFRYSSALNIMKTNSAGSIYQLAN
jgi:hypothetical protein